LRNIRPGCLLEAWVAVPVGGALAAPRRTRLREALSGGGFWAHSRRNRSNEAGRFVFRGGAPTAGGQTCTLGIGASKSHLTLTDAPAAGVSTCQDFCGARGSFRDYRIELRKRRPIRYPAAAQGLSPASGGRGGLRQEAV